MPEFQFAELDQPAAAVAALRDAKRIGVDTEFMREKTYFAQLCLVQFSVGEALWCADPLPADDLQAFWDALLAPAWVVHSGRQDFEVISQAAGRLPASVFDTQVAAALLGYTPQLGYANLVAELFDVELAKSHTRADWSRRPLPPGALDYAAEDVEWLLPACDILRERLDKRDRLAWAEEDCRDLLDPALYAIDTANAVDRVKGARNLRGRVRRAAALLARWREERAVAGNRPRQWILRDSALLEIAHANPRNAAQLSAVNDLPPAVARRSGRELLALLREAEATEDDYQPPGRPDDAEKALTKALQKQVAECARELGIAAEVLAPRRELAAAVSGARDLRVFRGWRAEVIGGDIERLLAAG